MDDINKVDEPQSLRDQIVRLGKLIRHVNDERTIAELEKMRDDAQQRLAGLTKSPADRRSPLARARQEGP